ncbi:MAG: ABC transporter ATP-binding protein [Clostridia bacterium]|nr:ABC transporter ATP-binding protein [Clostridia bacterium]
MQPQKPQTEQLRWFKYVRPYLPWFIIGPLCMIVEVIGEVVMPKLLAYIIDFGVTHKMTDPPAWLSWVYGILNQSFDDPDAPLIVALAVGMVLTAVLMMIGGVGGAYFGAKASVNFAADLRADIYRKVQRFSFANIDKFNTGSLVTRLTNDVTQLQNVVNTLLRMALRSPGMLIGALIMAVTLNRQLALVLAFVVPTILVVIVLFIFVGLPRFNAMQEKVDGLNSSVQENVTNVRVVKSFVREDYESRRFAETKASLKRAGRRAMMVMIWISPLMSFFMNAAVLAVLWFGGNMVLTEGMLVGDLTAFVTYITQILSSLMMVTMLFMQASRAMASGKRIKAVMNEEIDISDAAAACPDKQVERGEIEFRNVTFRYYKGSEGKVLDNVNLKIGAGSTVGIIGSTGSGKTTLVSMIPRLYDTDEGEVLVDGVNVKDYSLYNLREGVGMVLQKNVLFSGTIEDNLRWGDGEADMEALRAAADSAQADGFIMGFEKGYQSDLGQGGTNVSGGQKQRLCIARALLKKPKILILDDSTSAVDTATEARIREAFRGELRDTTKIIIAQRITSVMEADCIIVVNEGRITGMGTHDDLLASNVEYKEIYDSQMEAARHKAELEELKDGEVNA